MMKKIFIYCFAIIIFLFAACKQESKNTFLIEGKISNLTNPELIFITNLGQDSLTVDTIISKNGRFSFRGQADSLSAITIYMEEGEAWTTVWAQNGQKITLSGDAVYPKLILAKGNNINDILSIFRERNQGILREKQDLLDRKNALGAIDSLNSDAVNEYQYASKILNLNYTLKEKVEVFVKENSASLASLILIQDYIVTWGELDRALKCLGYMEREVTETTYYKELHKEINDLITRIKNADIGSPAPDFSVVTIDKDTLTLKSFENKYLLLSFSASWCEFCRESNKDLVKIRKAIDKKKLEMITIALDQDKIAWKDFAKEEKMDWYQSVDTLEWRSQMAYSYNIDEIPASILIDKSGVIVGRDLPVDSLIRIFK